MCLRIQLKAQLLNSRYSLIFMFDKILIYVSVNRYYFLYFVKNRYCG
jgi:hypothetical protein